MVLLAWPVPLLQQVSLGITSAGNWLPTALAGLAVQVSGDALTPIRGITAVTSPRKHTLCLGRVALAKGRAVELL